MHARVCGPAERTSDFLDRASSLSFTVVASLTGLLDPQRIERALRCVERRHPLLRARIEYGVEGERFVFGEAAPIPLSVVHAGENTVLEQAVAQLNAASFGADGPRARATLLQHGVGGSSVLLCMHHTTSDGTSGMLVMRDLLGYAARGDDAEDVVALASPGQDAFFPAEHAQLKAAFQARLAAQGTPERRAALRVGDSVPELHTGATRTAAERFVLDEAISASLQRNAKHCRTTVHGVLCAALSVACGEVCAEPGLLRIVHPVDLRRYLLERNPEGPRIGDACGYYVSALTTEHDLETAGGLSPLARRITAAVRSKKHEYEPLLTAPVQGPSLIALGSTMTLDTFRQLGDQKLFLNTFSLSNLGRLEALGVSTDMAGLEAVKDLYFVAATGILARVGASALSFGGRLAMQISYVTPSVEPRDGRQIAERTRQLLIDFARLDC